MNSGSGSRRCFPLTTVHDWRPATNAGQGGAVAPSSPTVARWELSLRIRERRRELGLDVKSITSQLGFSRNYWSAVENDRTLLADEKLEALFDILEFSDTDRDELRDLRQQARRRGWWMDYPVLDTDELREVQHYYGLEAGAAHVRSFEGAIVTGLLQTEEYARAMMTTDPARSMLQVDQFVEIRMTRQRLLRGEHPLRLTTVMSEAAIHQEIGGRAVLARQLRHLLTLIEELGDTLELRIMPFASTPGGILGASTLYILDFASTKLDRLVWRESIGPLGVIDDPTTVHWIELSYDQAVDHCLDQQASAELIERRANELVAPAGEV